MFQSTSVTLDPLVALGIRRKLARGFIPYFVILGTRLEGPKTLRTLHLVVSVFKTSQYLKLFRKAASQIESHQTTLV